MNFHSDEWIIDKLNEHYDYATDHLRDHEVIGVFLHGSQNYGLDFETSDVDSICLVMPNKHDILKAKEPISKKLAVNDNGEEIIVWEVRKFINLLEKGGFNQLEILFTDYYVLNVKYAFLWAFIKRNNEDILYLNPYKTANSFLGMINRCVKEINKENTNYCKEYMRIEFFGQCLNYYLNHKPFKEILKPTNADELKEIRNKSLITFTRIDALTKAEDLFNYCKELINSYDFNNKLNHENGIITINAIRDVLFNQLKDNIEQ